MTQMIQVMTQTSVAMTQKTVGTLHFDYPSLPCFSLLYGALFQLARKNGWRGREKHLEEKLREMELGIAPKK